MQNEMTNVSSCDKVKMYIMTFASTIDTIVAVLASICKKQIRKILH